MYLKDLRFIGLSDWIRLLSLKLINNLGLVHDYHELVLDCWLNHMLVEDCSMFESHNRLYH